MPLARVGGQPPAGPWPNAAIQPSAAVWAGQDGSSRYSCIRTPKNCCCRWFLDRTPAGDFSFGRRGEIWTFVESFVENFVEHSACFRCGAQTFQSAAMCSDKVFDKVLGTAQRDSA